VNNTDPSSAPNDLKAKAEKIVLRLQQSGHVAYLAGGCVRDMLLGRKPQDYDIATSAVPDDVMALFDSSCNVGKSFGVVRVTLDDSTFEVATFRQDHDYGDGRHPKNVTFTDARTDAQRRDFTINALFYDPATEEIHDFVDGRSDLDKRIIRCVGEAQDRMAEDYLRILRAVRFASVLEFDIDDATQAAIESNANGLRAISAERIRDEITRILCEAPRAGQAFLMLERFKVLRVVLPDVADMRGQAQPPEFHPEGDVLDHTVLMLDMMASPSPVLAWSTLLHDVGKPITAEQAPDRIRFNMHAQKGSQIAQRMLKDLRFSSADTDDIAACVGGHMRFMDVQKMKPSTLRRMTGAKTFPVELELHRLDCTGSHGKLDNYEFLVQFLEALKDEPVLPDPWVTGDDIMALGIAQGPAVGRWRKDAYDMQLDGSIESREDLLQWLSERVKSELDGTNS
jgi:putative nucleotidyltransferase with HDIG domain